MGRNLLLLAVACMGLSNSAKAQVTSTDIDDQFSEQKSGYIPVSQYWKEHNIFQHLEGALTLGTTGIGVEIASPMGHNFLLRAGFSYMPKFKYNMNFDVQVGDDPAKSDSKFERLSGMLESMTGYHVNNSIDMIGEPTWYNAHLMVDFFPFKRNRHWYFTAGVYLGPKRMAKAYNTTEDMPSLMAVGMYNNMYEKAINYDYLVSIGDINWPEDIKYQDELYKRFSSYGRMGVHVGDYAHDVYYPENVYYEEDIYNPEDGTLIHAKGDVLHAKGDVLHAKGDPYVMEPDADGMVKAQVRVNSIKPYIGFGYSGRLVKGSDRYKFSFDCGVMFWGGTPSIVTHDGTDLVNDVQNISGKVGTYVDVIKAFKVFPVLNIRLSKTLF